MNAHALKLQQQTTQRMNKRCCKTSLSSFTIQIVQIAAVALIAVTIASNNGALYGNNNGNTNDHGQMSPSCIFVEARRSSSSSAAAAAARGSSSKRRSKTSASASNRRVSASSRRASARNNAFDDDDDDDEDDDDADRFDRRRMGRGQTQTEEDDDEEEEEMNFGFLDEGHDDEEEDDDDGEEEEPIPARRSGGRTAARAAKTAKTARAAKTGGGNGKKKTASRRQYLDDEDDYENEDDNMMGFGDEDDFDDEDDYYQPDKRRSNPSSSRSRSSSSSRERGSGGRGRSSGRRSNGGNVVPYGNSRGRGGRHHQPRPTAFTRGLAALRDSIPDPTSIKDSAINSISAAKKTTSKLTSNIYREVKGLTSSELEQVMLKATAPNDVPVKGKHVERLVGVTYQISGRYDIYDAVLRKLWSKMVENDWRTTVKSLYILHRFSADGAPDHQAALKARLRELRRTRDPKRGKEKYFNSKQLLSGDTSVSSSIHLK